MMCICVFEEKIVWNKWNSAINAAFIGDDML